MQKVCLCPENKDLKIVLLKVDLLLILKIYIKNLMKIFIVKDQLQELQHEEVKPFC
jgi:hypothetical protein